MSTSHPQPLTVPAHASPVSPVTASSPGRYSRSNYSDMLSSPPVPPPRTSSTHHSYHTNTTTTSTGSSAERVSGSRHTKTRQSDERERSGSDRNVSHRERPRDQPSDSSRSHRKAHPPSEESSRGTSGKLPMASRMEQIPPESDMSSGTLTKESSKVINQLLVSDPAVDLEREQARQLSPQVPASTESAPVSSSAGLVGSDGADDGSSRGAARSRHDYGSSSSGKRKETTFGSYILGQTLGEGEFGKVKLGWKRDGSVQVAIKLIRRESLGSNPSRLPKIYREIAILRDLSHPNIVRLHEMVETDRHIGIIMEYASGGELFDHILNNRYLKDHSARRLFAQLVSGVGYLHKKGIVHRDLKLENLLLDRNRNIIITDFGFANTFDPTDELDEEIEYNLTNKEFVKRMHLDKINSKGMRRGDLMQTSCGSPCYAAPELVVSDSLYTGRKVDVWSCGVILYAMLAGYLPFDDDPANPDGDNINLLYKYIVTTALTFPEYVTPHARDLLRRILVPDPRKRADLFEVARHSWLSEYSHVVSHITSSTTKVSDIVNTTVPTDQETRSLARSASVREPPKAHHNPVSTVGGLSHHAGDISQEQPIGKSKSPRDAKRRTVQVEYVAPHSQTARGESSNAMSAALDSNPAAEMCGTSDNLGGLLSQDAYYQGGSVNIGSREEDPRAPTNPMSFVAAPLPRSTSEAAGLTGTQTTVTARPTTGGSMASFNAGRLPSRGSYAQPVAPTVAATNAQGRLAQPKSKQYVISNPIPQDPSQISIGLPSTHQLPPKFHAGARPEAPKGHKRSNTVSGLSEKIFGRSGSIFGRTSQASSARPKPSKRYPPPSMKENFTGEDSRTSMDSRRSAQYGYSQKTSESGSEKPRRFSLLPTSFSVKGFSSSRSQTPDEELRTSHAGDSRMAPSSSAAYAVQTRTSAAGNNSHDPMGAVPEGPVDDVILPAETVNYQAHIDQQFAVLHGSSSNRQRISTVDSAPAEQVYQHNVDNSAGLAQQPSPSNFNAHEVYNGSYEGLPRQSVQVGRSARGASVLQKSNRKFADAYEYERDPSHHSGSSGAARKVMDFFRRRARSRAGDDR